MHSSAGGRVGGPTARSIRNVAWRPSRSSVAIWLSNHGPSSIVQRQRLRADAGGPGEGPGGEGGAGREARADDEALAAVERVAQRRADGLEDGRMGTAVERGLGEVGVVHVAGQQHDAAPAAGRAGPPRRR